MMKKTITFLILVLLCAASQAQVNPKMNELFDRLTAMGKVPHIVKTAGRNDPTHLTYSVLLYHRPEYWKSKDGLPLDSLLREDRNKLAEQVALIRHTLDELQQEAQESYQFECHRDGKDTITYAMNFSHDTTWVAKTNWNNHPNYFSKEYLNFQYEPEGKGFRATLEYVIATPKERQDSALSSLDDLKADIASLMKQHHVKPRKAYWLHDEAYSDSIWNEGDNSIEFLSTGSFGEGYSLAGESDVTIYTVQEEGQALRLLAAVDSLAQKHTDNPKEYHVQYELGTTFEETYFKNMMLSIGTENLTERNFSIKIHLAKSGYHFLVIDTKGVEWMPYYCISLKSFVNGKKVFFKGMEPKQMKSAGKKHK